MNKRVGELPRLMMPRSFLPELNDDVRRLVDRAKRLRPDDVQGMIAHLKESLRTDGLSKSTDVELYPGQPIMVKAGAPVRFVGMRGKVLRAARQRCYVQLEGHPTEVYLFKSDVEVLSSNVSGMLEIAAHKLTGTHG